MWPKCDQRVAKIWSSDSGAICWVLNLHINHGIWRIRAVMKNEAKKDGSGLSAQGLGRDKNVTASQHNQIHSGSGCIIYSSGISVDTGSIYCQNTCLVAYPITWLRVHISSWSFISLFLSCHLHIDTEVCLSIILYHDRDLTMIRYFIPRLGQYDLVVTYILTLRYFIPRLGINN